GKYRLIAAVSFEPRDGSRHPSRHLHLRWVWNLSALLRYVRRAKEPLACDVSQFPMNRAGPVHCLLAEYDATSSVSKMPIEDWQAATDEPMCLATRIDDELQGDVVRRGVCEHRLCSDCAMVVRDQGVLECRLLPNHF